MPAAAARLATTADIDRAADTLALAHEQYEWAMWAFPGPDRTELLRQLFALDLELAASVQSAWVDDDVSSVAIWSPPAPVHVDRVLADRVNASQNELIGADATRLTEAHGLTAAHRPSVPFWYLGTVGTRPEHRGRGLATQIIRPVLDVCDRDRVVACLETSSEDNVRLYRRLGFDEVFRTSTGDAGKLPLIVMHRQPC